MSDDDLFEKCALTCEGGSERGRCGCCGPAECYARKDPSFPAARWHAKQRMTEAIVRIMKTKRGQA